MEPKPTAYPIGDRFAADPFSVHSVSLRSVKNTAMKLSPACTQSFSIGAIGPAAGRLRHAHFMLNGNTGLEDRISTLVSMQIKGPLLSLFVQPETLAESGCARGGSSLSPVRPFQRTHQGYNKLRTWRTATSSTFETFRNRAQDNMFCISAWQLFPATKRS